MRFLLDQCLSGVKRVDIVRFEKGKAVEHWGVTDSGVMMQQLTGAGAKAK